MKAFGILFGSKERTVYQWEHGFCVPRLAKLIQMSSYYGVSLDCILCGKAVNNNALEKYLSRADEKTYLDNSVSWILDKYYKLSDKNKERLMGYLDALSTQGN